MTFNNTVCVVTVTYGDRWKYLNKVLDSLISKNYVKKILIVDNASNNDIKSLSEKKSKLIEVISLKENTGSAYAYNIGLKKGIESGTEFLWLLDDDNVPNEDALEKLINVFQEKAFSNSNFYKTNALLSLRTDRKEYLNAARKGSSKKFFLKRDSFLGFHFYDVFLKIYRKFMVKSKNDVLKNNYHEPVSVPVAPYGGLFFHKELISRIGLPNKDFYLYADDHEFTYRITKLGGEILLVPNSVIDDIDKSWFLKSNKPYILSLYDTPDSFRVYYGVRNRIYFENKDLVDNKVIYRFNKFVFILFLYLISIIKNNKDRFSLIKQAIYEGEHGKLGIYKQSKI